MKEIYLSLVIFHFSISILKNHELAQHKMTNEMISHSRDKSFLDKFLKGGAG